MPTGSVSAQLRLSCTVWRILLFHSSDLDFQQFLNYFSVCTVAQGCFLWPLSFVYNNKLLELCLLLCGGLRHDHLGASGIDIDCSSESSETVEGCELISASKSQRSIHFSGKSPSTRSPVALDFLW